MNQDTKNIPIAAGVQSLLRRWIKERDALEAQIGGVLQSVVVGRPGTWELDDSLAFMTQSAPAVMTAPGAPESGE